MKKIAVFASGSGSNAQNIIEFFQKESIASVVLVLSNNPKAHVLERAKALGVDAAVFNKNELTDPKCVLNQLLDYKIDFIVLAGFLWKFPEHIIHKFKHNIVNIHPALLPHFGGKGMYGMHVHRAVVAEKIKETGITIHHVNAQYDDGAIIFQAKCVVDEDDTPEKIAQKIHKLEMKYFPIVIKDLLIKND
jgi:phosphoribosylglycinamide formyltransferase-1